MSITRLLGFLAVLVLSMPLEAGKARQAGCGVQKAAKVKCDCGCKVRKRCCPCKPVKAEKPVQVEEAAPEPAEPSVRVQRSSRQSCRQKGCQIVSRKVTREKVVADCPGGVCSKGLRSKRVKLPDILLNPIRVPFDR